MILGVDTGGTFTDFVLLDEQGGAARLRSHKVLSTPEAPERAILQGIEEMGLADAVTSGKVRIIHGSTVATNAALEGKGAATALVTNRGFGDMLSIARQTRPGLYALESSPRPVPVPPELCLETGGRLAADGRELEPLDDAELDALARRLEALAVPAVAINLLFSFLDDAHERRIADYLRQQLPQRTFITRSSEILPEYREYERGIATWLNASLGPLVRAYLLSLKEATAPSPLSVMQSSGGTIDAAQAAGRAVNLLMSGPAGGLAAADSLGRMLGEERLMTFDMGGTSTDVALLEGGVRLSSEGSIGPWPVAVPMVDMHTIGAGGGSIAHVDGGGLLQVGPRSAGASPGPACYGRGGSEPTVTDANLLLGRLPADAALAGSFSLDPAAARAAMAPLASKLGLGIEEAAQGIVTVANEHMARALRVISVERGHDAARFRLCCFGGAGGLHICRLAESLEMDKAMVPANAGVLSALGMLLAPVERQLSRTHQCLLEEAEEAGIDEILRLLREAGMAELRREGLQAGEVEEEAALDLRYRGQSATLTVPWQGRAAAADFHRLHEQRYGHSLPAPVEVVNVRLALKGPAAARQLAEIPPRPDPAPRSLTRLWGHDRELPVFDWSALGRGARLQGPALVCDKSSTTYIEPGWAAAVDIYGNLMLGKVRPSRES